MRTLGI
jgi:hypothetical protein